MLLSFAFFALWLTEVAALPTGWSAGADDYFGLPGDADFDYVCYNALGKAYLSNRYR